MRATTTKTRAAARDFGILALLLGTCFIGLFLLQLADGITQYTQGAARDVAAVKDNVLAADKGASCEWHNATSAMGPFHLRELYVRTACVHACRRLVSFGMMDSLALTDTYFSPPGTTASTCRVRSTRSRRAAGTRCRKLSCRRRRRRASTARTSTA